MRRAAAAILLWAGLCSSALAQDAGRPATITLTDIQAAQLLILNNRLDDANRVLARVLAAKPDDTEALFLTATIAVEQKDYDTAISLFRRILAREPPTERVRTYSPPFRFFRFFRLKGR